MNSQPTEPPKISDKSPQTEAHFQMRSASHQMQLQRLHYWLTIERSSGLFLLILFVGVPFIPVLMILGIAALAFTPLIVKVLAQTGRWRWITAFAVMVGVPCVLLFFPVESPVLAAVIQLLPFLMFYFFCWLLRMAVENWLEELT